VPLHTLRAEIDYGFAEANTVYGKLGVKCWICKGETKPGKAAFQPATPVGAPRTLNYFKTILLCPFNLQELSSRKMHRGSRTGLATRGQTGGIRLSMDCNPGTLLAGHQAN